MVNLRKKLDVLVNKLLEESPLFDRFGNKFIVVSFAFVRCFFKAFNYNVDFEGQSSDTTIYLYLGYLTTHSLRYTANPISMSLRFTEDLYKDLVCKILDVYKYNFNVSKLKTPGIYLLRKSTVTNFDLNSAIASFSNLIDTDPQNKYLFPLYITESVNSKKMFKVFDFMNNFEEDKKYIMATYDKFKHLNINQVELVEEKHVDAPTTEPFVVKEESICTKSVVKDETPIDKRIILDDNMTLKEMNELCQYITDAIKFLEGQGINWRDKIKVNFNKDRPRIDDSCGYPVVINDEDFLDRAPFPECIEGDAKLANL